MRGRVRRTVAAAAHAVLPRRVRESLVEAADHRRLNTVELSVLHLDRRLRRLTLDVARLMYGGGDDGTLASAEFSVRSQNGEDGVLLRIFSVIGTHNRSFVEFGIGDGRECNAANLALNWGWDGLFLEGGTEAARSAREFYERSATGRVTVEEAFVTRENIDGIIRGCGISGEVDLLSVDIDGNDYWVLDSVSSISPRVITVEYNASFGPLRAVTIPYIPNFQRTPQHPWYHGASLAALVGLVQRRGYSFVGCEEMGVNAFFVRNDCLVPPLTEVDPTTAWRPHARRLLVAPQEQQEARSLAMSLVEVPGPLRSGRLRDGEGKAPAAFS